MNAYNRTYLESRQRVLPGFQSTYSQGIFFITFKNHGRLYMPKLSGAQLNNKCPNMPCLDPGKREMPVDMHHLKADKASALIDQR